MKTREFFEQQHASLQEVEQLTTQLASGEIGEAEGLARIEAAMQTLEAKTSGYQRRQPLRSAMPRVLRYSAIFVILLLALVGMRYFRQAV